MISTGNCSGCGKGSYQTGVGATLCSLCETGTYNPNTTSDNASACQICPL